MPTESPFQVFVTNHLLNEQHGKFVVDLTEKHLAVLITAGDHEAAYTADEARQLADAIEQETDDHLHSDRFEVLAEYIRDVADVVDRKRTYDAIEAKWDKRDLMNDPEDVEMPDADPIEPMSIAELADGN